MVFQGFIGAGYALPSKQAATQECINFYPEVIEDPTEKKNRIILQPTPCAGFLTVPPNEFPGVSRGLIELNGLIFGINGPYFFQYELPREGNDGGYNRRNPSNPILGDDFMSMIANGVTTKAQQIMIAGDSRAFNYSVGGVFVDLSAVDGFMAGRGCAFLNDFFISLIPGTNGFQVSHINDGTKWSAADVAYTQGQSDTLVGLIADRQYLWLFGGRRSEVWVSQASQFFPFQPVPNAFIEIGLMSRMALVQADNTLFLLGQNKGGGKSIYRMNGFTPIRVSNHALDTEIASYGDVSDTIGYSFLWRGHAFVRFIFPKADKSWTYDCAASNQLGFPIWHRNRYTDSLGQDHATVERSHCYANGLHLIGSGGAEGQPGTMYKFTDTTSIAVDPTVTLRISKDGGETYGPEVELPVGASGDFGVRTIRRNLGASRTPATFWVRCTDYGDAVFNADGSGASVVQRDRISPHTVTENKWTIYRSFELDLQKGIGSQDGATDGFFCLSNAYLESEQ